MEEKTILQKRKGVKSAVDSWYLRRDSLKEIGKAFKSEKYSTVSSIVEGMKKEIRKDNIFKKRVDQLIGKLDPDQVQLFYQFEKKLEMPVK